ncbi:hypothetical protein NFI96_015427 [Prochilodus magdalenae]|nr:hypothetical protein NFI96_015427 [Prochilodus magdalenae]
MENSILQSTRKESSTGSSMTDQQSSEIHQHLFKPLSLDLQQEFQCDQNYNLGEMHNLLTTRPHEFKHCKLKMEKHNLAYAKPLNDPTMVIKITGRDDIGRSFPGDEVCVQILSREEQEEGELVTGKVVGLMKRDEERYTFICTMDGLGPFVTPVKNNMTKIRIIQTKPGKIEIRKVDFTGRWKKESFVEMAEDQLLVVKVLKWEKQRFYPLGVVTKVLPFRDYLHEIFSKRSEIQDTPASSFQPRDDKEEDGKREDFRDDITFTIDPMNAQDLDDAISLTDQGETFVIGVHITDVASFISKDSKEDTNMKKMGRTFYPPPEAKLQPDFMVSRQLSSKYLSLLPKMERKAISLITVVNKSTNAIESSRFTLSHIMSNRRLSYEKADKIIQKHCLDNSGPLCFSNVAECVATAYRFAETHRKCRMDGGWSSGDWRSGQRAEKSRAHCMVKELMILYNSAVAEELISDDLTRDLTPMRCHQKPDHENLEQFKIQYSELLPLSPYLSHIFPGVGKSTEDGTDGEEEDDDDDDDDVDEEEEEDVDEEEEEEEEEEENNDATYHYDNDNVDDDDGDDKEEDDKVIYDDDDGDDDEDDDEEEGTERFQDDDKSIIIVTSVLQKMKTLAENRDYHTLVQLIVSDGIHPTLLPMAREFKDLQSKAVILRSCSSLSSKLGHFDLQLNAYTWASSPMRRYLDLILQRLLHSVLCGKEMAEYTKADIDQFCDSSMEQSETAEDLNLQALQIIATNKFSSGVKTKLAVVDKLPPKQYEFMIALPFDQVFNRFTIMYRHLKIVEQPKHNSDKKSVTLHWKRRVYSFNDGLKTQIDSTVNRNVTSVSIKKWRRIISAVKVEDWDKVRRCLKGVRTGGNRKHKNSREETCSKDSQHFKKFNLELRAGKVLQVQLGTEIIQGMMTPTVKLLNVNPFFEVCLEHARNPIVCFFKNACDPSKDRYRDYEEYQKIWSGICKIDTAYNAVEENNSVILETVKITWTNVSDTDLKGFFRMTQERKKKWQLEFDLTNCFFCIRLRGQHPEKEKQSEDTGLSGLQDTLPFTWVAHGVAVKSEAQMKKETRNKQNIKINFQINHQSMSGIPQQVFNKDTRFTVEVIPKKIPYVLNENAVANIKKANELVKSIATGNVPARNMKDEELHSLDHQKVDLPPLNESQQNAVQEALQNPFTVIQGPPGTGKTVVGVHITYHFYMKNKELEEQEAEQVKQAPKHDQNVPKKRGILYCGPSNKSVDIVAEQLMKLDRVLKPLRIYCDQMEMREFPYPGSKLKLCRKSLRDEKPKEKLRSITLMYLVRKPENPHSEEIKNLKDGTAEFDLDSYRKALKKAQRHELMKHDVVLCTCSTALNPNLIKTMDFRQILIDECAMATEPEAFIPLVSHNPEKIVILGDHKQIQPIVTCGRVKELGMQRSLFERYMSRALMLDTQYRMHESICEFPSNEFYEGKLKTGAVRGPLRLLNNKNEPTAILFGHVKGKEDSLVVSTAAGNEYSVANKLEAEQAVRIAELLIRQSGVKPEDIAILTPYNAQVCAVKKILKEMKKERQSIENVSVCTIMKSQGSEWPYVIVSTVRSCPLHEIRSEPNPSRAWMGRKLGFITDPNQVNVAITRAQDGLCILGNHHLLKCNDLWRKLLRHYESQGCLMDSAENIKVIAKDRLRRPKGKSVC